MDNTDPARAAIQTGMTARERKVAMIGVLATMFLAALDQTIVTPAMPTIGGELGDSHYLPWIVTAYLLCATATAPLYGKVSDIHGRRRTLYAAVGLFLLGSLIAALAPNLFVLIAARAVQGLGGGGIFALSQIVIGDLFPPLERARYVAWIAGMWAVAGIAGPLLGGTLAEHYWPLIFWLNLPLGVGAMLVVDGPLRKLPVIRHAHSLDGWGAVLLVAATALLLLMLNWGGSTYSWLSFEILALGAASLLLWIGFGIRVWTAAEPLVSLDVLSNRIVLAGSFGMFLVSAANVGLTVYLPVYAQGYLGLSAAQSGYVLVGFLLGAVTGANFSGRLASRVQRVKWLAAIGSAASCVAFVAAGLLAGQKSIVVLEILLVLIGAPLGMVFPVTTVSVQNGVDRMHLGVATGMLTFLRSLGSALGVAVLGTIALSHGVPLGAESARGVIGQLPSAEPFAVLYYVMAAIMLAAAVAYAVMPHKPLRGGA